MLEYKRTRFGTRLPEGILYTRSHYWLAEAPNEPGLWRVGFTKFALRMLGDLVEFQLEPAEKSETEIGARIGWIEGFKAVSDLYSVIEGEFVEFNSLLATNPTFMDRDPYDRGWLYMARGKPDARVVDCQGYIAALDVAIDRILSQEQQEQKKC